jgi:hypothetical protein
MLDSHERIAIPQETGFLRLATAHLWVPYWQLGDTWSGNLDLTDAGLLSALADFYGGLFASYAESRGKQRWGDKTPFHVWHLQLAMRLFPECQVVGIVRHPGAVVSSLRRRFRRTLPDATGHWRRSTTQLLLEATSIGDRCAVLRYEDLVIDPEATMRTLLSWLDEPWSDAVLSHHEVQQRAGTQTEVEGFTRSDIAINQGYIADWEQHLRGDALARVVERTNTLAEFLGYTPESARPLNGWGHPILTGSEIRQRQLSHGVTWKRPRPNPEDLPLRPPAPRPHRQASVSLDDVAISDVLRNRMVKLGGRLPDGPRKSANKLRRSHPLIDRILGPRQPRH